MIFLALVIMVRKEAARAPIWFAVLLTIVVQLPQLFFQPRTSDDAYRYIWDGRVLLAGVDPYRFAALDSALAGLRYPLLFPEGELPLISRPEVSTIYSPIAQLWLALVAFFTPRAAGRLGLQIAAAGAVVLTTWLLARFLGNRQGGWVLLYGACPAVALGIVVLVGLRRWGKGRHQRWKLHSSWNSSAQSRRRSRAAGSAGLNFPANSPGTALASRHAVGLA
jgi:hypothetical protein